MDFLSPSSWASCPQSWLPASATSPMSATMTSMYQGNSTPVKKKVRSKPKCPIKRKVQRQAANSRERTRMQIINGAFDRLKDRIPLICKDRKLSKVGTLRMAIEYIHHLQAVANGGKAGQEQTRQDRHHQHLPEATSTTSCLPMHHTPGNISSHSQTSTSACSHPSSPTLWSWQMELEMGLGHREQAKDSIEEHNQSAAGNTFQDNMQPWSQQHRYQHCNTGSLWPQQEDTSIVLDQPDFNVLSQ